MRAECMAEGTIRMNNHEEIDWSDPALDTREAMERALPRAHRRGARGPWDCTSCPSCAARSKRRRRGGERRT